jgi:hypothetical protein
MLGQEAVGIAHIGKETGLTRQTVYRIKDEDVPSRPLSWGRNGLRSDSINPYRSG